MKHLYTALPAISAALSLMVSAKSGYEVLGLWIATAYLTWNIYAYFNGKRMLPPMNYKVDYSVHGDKAARAFLAGLCVVLYLFVIAIWIFGAD